MTNFKIKKNKGFTPTPNFLKKGNLVWGFTLVETMFAVLILTFTIVGLMTVVANSLFAARYARDEITVNYLLQEVVDYVRNDRDTTVFLESGGNWNTFLEKYDNCSSQNGCYFDVLNLTLGDIKSCLYSSTGNGCPFLYYDESANDTPFYTNDDNLGNIGEGEIPKVKTNFKRKIIIQNASNPDEINVIVKVDWKNGGKEVTRSLSTSLMNWQK
ncbi:MAG: type II secretion system protein [Candidatus Paceibacterota bacterium]